MLNDIHSQLNQTRVERIETVRSAADIVSTIRAARAEGRAISVAGGRHAMGAQQFGTGTVHVDTRSSKRVLGFDRENGVIEVEAGIEWPELIEWTSAAQVDDPSNAWGIIQKQTGADHLTIGGALSANAHGRGLSFKPIIDDVDSLTLIDADGELHTCSRRENPDLFKLVIGGYGLFGIIYSVKLRLRRREKLQRIVEIRSAEGLNAAFEQRIREGYLYGDFQFETNEASPSFLTRGVFACYRPVPIDTPIPPQQEELSYDDWVSLLYLGHADKARAFDRYAEHYRSTSGQIYWSDTHQLAIYPDHYHRALDARLKVAVSGSEMISEVYVPRSELAAFLAEAAVSLRDAGANVIYGTVRLIEQDTESFLPWAKQRYACIVFNLHVDHDRQGIEGAKTGFRTLIDLARKRGGSYFLTYHRWATPEQLEACYPQFARFLQLKKKYDPDEHFQSDWYRHYRSVFG